jgi:hypothetical protein
MTLRNSISRKFALLYFRNSLTTFMVNLDTLELLHVYTAISFSKRVLLWGCDKSTPPSVCWYEIRLMTNSWTMFFKNRCAKTTIEVLFSILLKLKLILQYKTASTVSSKHFKRLEPSPWFSVISDIWDRESFLAQYVAKFSFIELKLKVNCRDPASGNFLLGIILNFLQAQAHDITNAQYINNYSENVKYISFQCLNVFSFWSC